MSSFRIRRGRFEFRVWVNGQSISKTFSDRREGQRWAASLESGLQEPLVAQTIPSVTPTLVEAAERFHQETRLEKKGARQELERIRALHRLDWSSKPLTRVSSADLKRYRDQALQRGLSPSTVRLMLSTVSVIFKHAQFEWGLDVQNPVEQVKLPRPPRARQRRLREGEEERLFEALNQCKSPYIALAATIAIETGMRRSEMLGLRWSDLDLKRGVVHLRDTKNGRPRWVPLTQEALLAISRIRSLSDTTSDRIFPISASLLAQAWGHAIKRAGVEDLRWHDLRHEALSRWAHRLKGDVFKLSLVSGHRTLQMAQRYVHPVQAEILRIADMTV